MSSDHVFTVTFANAHPGRPWKVECSCGQLVMDATADDIGGLVRRHIEAQLSDGQNA